VIYFKIVVFSRFFVLQGTIFLRKGVGKGRFVKGIWMTNRFFFNFVRFDFQLFRMFLEIFSKKYFVSLENGCIFALAFDGKQEC